MKIIRINPIILFPDTKNKAWSIFNIIIKYKKLLKQFLLIAEPEIQGTVQYRLQRTKISCTRLCPTQVTSYTHGKNRNSMK